MNRGPVLTRRMKPVETNQQAACEPRKPRRIIETTTSTKQPAILSTTTFENGGINCASSVPLLTKQVSQRNRNAVVLNGCRLLWVKRAWALHFAVAVVVLGIGIRQNDLSRKYIPIFPPTKAGSDCDRAFLNVMAGSETEQDAIICCKNKELLAENGNLIETLTSICPSEVCCFRGGVVVCVAVTIMHTLTKQIILCTQNTDTCEDPSVCRSIGKVSRSLVHSALSDNFSFALQTLSKSL